MPCLDRPRTHRRPRRQVYLVSLFLALALAATPVPPAHANADTKGNETAALCDAAATAAARRHNVPLDVLRAISLTETGRRSNGAFRPWPWTVNMEGHGEWFDTSDAAQAFVDRHVRRGARSFDVGCFQINHRWHGHAFASVEAMFDPLQNADYAARFLSELHAETGDWSRAAGAYHSRTPHRARKYRKRFEELLARVSKAPALPAPQTETAQIQDVRAGAEPEVGSEHRVNTYPLLRASGAPIGIGSLVPLGDKPARKPLVPSG